MSHPPLIARSLLALYCGLDQLRARNASIALVPTMGALVRAIVRSSVSPSAERRTKKVVVSIFVNPTQFAANEDLGCYPRTWKADIAKLTADGVGLVWNPDVPTRYPQDFATRVAVEGPARVDLEDRFWPHFFGGVATVGQAVH